MNKILNFKVTNVRLSKERLKRPTPLFIGKSDALQTYKPEPEPEFEPDSS